MSESFRGLIGRLRDEPISSSRVNEVGNKMERHVIDSLKQNGLEASAPRTVGNRKRSAGYPDILVLHEPVPAYLEVKTYAQGTEGSGIRSFFFSPSGDPKVSLDAHHLAVGFEMERDGNDYRPVSFKIKDLHGLPCSVKVEVHSSNARLYEGKLLADSSG